MSNLALIVIVVAIVAVLIIIGLVFAFRDRLGMGPRPLPEESRARYARAWKGVESRFIEDPRSAVQEADKTVVMMLSERGARLDDHGRMPGELREAREAAASDNGRQGTEGMRQAMVHYKKLVEDAVGKQPARAEDDRRREVAS